MINKFLVPRRLINSQCGSTWSATGNTATYTNYLEPAGIHFYRMHPNYFFTTEEDNLPAVKIDGSNAVKFTICTSRNPLHINLTDETNCATITSQQHKITMGCADNNFIHQCSPIYLSITANPDSNSINRCTGKFI